MDWKATLEEILAERRERLGEPPSFDDLVALRAGELPEGERRRLLERAAVDPEVARELFDVLRFPRLSGDEDPAADEDGVDERWQALRRCLAAEGVLPPGATGAAAPAATRPPAWLALAATFLLGVAAALLAGRFRDPGDGAAAPAARLNLPIVELLPAGDATGLRGGAEALTLAAEAGGVVLALAAPAPAAAPERGPFTLELARGDGTSTTFGGLAPGAGGVFVLDLPREDLAGGLHVLRLRDARGKLVARFELEVELRE